MSSGWFMVAKYKREIKEFQTEMQGKLEDADEAIFQLKKENKELQLDIDSLVKLIERYEMEAAGEDY